MFFFQCSMQFQVVTIRGRQRSQVRVVAHMNAKQTKKVMSLPATSVRKCEENVFERAEEDVPTQEGLRLQDMLFRHNTCLCQLASRCYLDHGWDSPASSVSLSGTPPGNKLLPTQTFITLNLWLCPLSLAGRGWMMQTFSLFCNINSDSNLTYLQVDP